jgi:hypothetical protein
LHHTTPIDTTSSCYSVNNSNAYVIGEEDHSKYLTTTKNMMSKETNGQLNYLFPTARHGLATVFIDDENIKYI